MPTGSDERIGHAPCHSRICAQDLYTSIDETSFPKVITGDESWVYSFDPETKQQSSQ
jgi:hypothetical protein